MAFLDMLQGLQDPQQLQSPFPSSADSPYGAIQGGIPPEVQAMNKPTTDPAEIDRRKEGWFQVVQHALSDPNITRAIGMFGAAMGRPMAPNETVAGRFAQSYAVGRSAYDQGLLAQEGLDRRRREDLMKQESHDVGMESQRTQTEAARAGIPGTVARGELAQSQARVATATEDTAIATAKTNAKKAEQELENAKTQAEIDQIKLRQQREHDAILQAIPEATKRAAVEAELKKAQADLDLKAAQRTQAIGAAASSQAHAKYFGAETRKATAEAQNLEDINALPVEERGRAKARSAGSQSAQVQMLEAVKSEYRRANPGKSDQEVSQFALNYVSQKKPEDRAERFLKWQEAFGKSNEKPEEALKRFDDFEKMMAGGSTATATSDGDRTGLPQPKTLAERNALPKGTRYVAPDGSIRTRQ